MKFSEFLLLLVATHVGFIFIKIYQHNALIRITYEKQRLEQKTETLKKEYYKEYAALIALARLDVIKHKATKEWGMIPVKWAHMKEICSLVETTTSSILVLNNPTCQNRPLVCLKNAPL